MYVSIIIQDDDGNTNFSLSGIVKKEDDCPRKVVNTASKFQQWIEKEENLDKEIKSKFQKWLEEDENLKKNYE